MAMKASEREARVKKIAGMIEKGMSVKEIAQSLGVREENARLFMARNNLETWGQRDHRLKSAKS